MSGGAAGQYGLERGEGRTEKSRFPGWGGGGSGERAKASGAVARGKYAGHVGGGAGGTPS